LPTNRNTARARRYGFGEVAPFARRSRPREIRARVLMALAPLPELI